GRMRMVLSGSSSELTSMLPLMREVSIVESLLYALTLKAVPITFIFTGPAVTVRGSASLCAMSKKASPVKWMVLPPTPKSLLYTSLLCLLRMTVEPSGNDTFDFDRLVTTSFCKAGMVGLLFCSHIDHNA